ncbi:hypothetical protein KKE34_04260 [Patescibacteria group bacterium]|nr:hypothetical protein [Patescibacteria group bacterium]MBU1885793.1 hypothetical protein [Patescibacteria group bacterium]
MYENFCLWIIPENSFYQEIEGVVSQYSKEYDSPIFTPHVTINGRVSLTDDQVIRKVEKAVFNIKSFEIEVGNVEFSTTYFQCVFVRMKTSAKLLETHLSLKNALGVKDQHVFMPHASLVYGDFDMKTREKIASEIKFKSTGFIAKKITIVRVDSSNPKDWNIVKQVPLG